MEETKIQWHPAFCSAIKLELIINKADLDYTSEFNLNSKPLQIDLLVIKKSSDVIIDNEIGHIFRQHNIFEYKSPEDTFNIDTYYKTLAYACLYKASGDRADSIKTDDITISMVHHGKPLKLLKYLASNNYIITNPYAGIYYVHTSNLFQMQLIVSSELNPEVHSWLTALTNQLSEKAAQQLIYHIESLEGQDVRAYADSVLSAALKANNTIFSHLNKEGTDMYEVLMEFMKPQVEKKIAAAVNKATTEQDAVHIIRSVNGIMAKFNASLDSACDAIGCTPDDYSRAKALLTANQLQKL